MPIMLDALAPVLETHLPPGLRLAMGMDTVDLDSIRNSLEAHGVRFEQRVFTSDELRDAQRVAGGYVERLAARFAAKEAAIKAFGLTEVGVDWREIEVRRAVDGRPHLVLHGRVSRQVGKMGVGAIEVSMSHDGRQACAVVAAILSTSQDANEPSS
jgi:holo-[acyl-carrier protein] synthase